MYQKRLINDILLWVVFIGALVVAFIEALVLAFIGPLVVASDVSGSGKDYNIHMIT